MTCRCEVLNVMTGEAAEDYADEHLDETRSDGQGRVYYRCSATGIGWVREHPRGPVTGESTQLRRTDRA